MWESYKNIQDNFLRCLYFNDIDYESFSGSVLYLGMGTCVLPRFQSDKVKKKLL